MAAPQGQDQGGGGQNSFFILWAIALVVFVGVVVWLLFSEPLKIFFIHARIYELTAISFILNFVATLVPNNLPWIGDFFAGAASNASNNLDIANQLTPDILTLDVAESLSTATGEYLRYPAVLILLFFSYLVYKLNVHARLKKKFDMKRLLLQEQVNWPAIQIVAKLDLLNEDLEKGPWAMNMTPLQFAKKNRLMFVDIADEPVAGYKSGNEYKITLDRVRAERAFTVQLGRTWQGIEGMAPHRRAIIAVFMARGCRDTKKAQELVAQLASSAAKGSLDIKGVDDLWRKHQKDKRVQEIFQQHGYEFTVFASMLLFAREDGVLASAEFLWVKPIDRRLWFVINSVGRQTPSVEAGGIFAHWYMELALKRSLSVPTVMGAVDALAIALSEVVYTPDDQEKEEIKKRHEVAPKSNVEEEEAQQAQQG